MAGLRRLSSGSSTEEVHARVQGRGGRPGRRLGQPVAEIARDLGIHEATLGNWVNLAKKNGTVIEKPVTADERARLRELEDEVRKLRMERDFLKKAAAWFASQNQ